MAYAAVEPAIIRRRLTILLRVVLVLAIAGAGAWVGALLIPLNHVSAEERYSILSGARDDLSRRASGIHPEALDMLAQDIAQRSISTLQHRDRSRVQGPARFAVVVAAVVFILVALLRANPGIWDDAVTAMPILATTLPCIFPAWQVVLEGPGQRQTVLGNHRSLKAARNAALRYARETGVKQVTIQWDLRPRNEYLDYCKEQPFL